MVRRLGLGKNNHLTYASLALNPRYLVMFYSVCHLIEVKNIIHLTQLFADMKYKLCCPVMCVWDEGLGMGQFP